MTVLWRNGKGVRIYLLNGESRQILRIKKQEGNEGTFFTNYTFSYPLLLPRSFAAILTYDLPCNIAGSVGSE